MIDARPLRILVVDDSPHDRLATVRALRRFHPDADLTEVATEPEWKAVVDGPSFSFDVVVLDFRLGWTDGIELLRELRARWHHLPIVMFTGTARDDTAIRALRDGVDEYLPKSQEGYRELERTLRFAIERGRQRAALQESEGRLSFLAQAGEVFASSLDHEATLQRVAQLSVPRLGDWCTVHLTRPGASAISLVATAHREPSRAGILEQLFARFPSRPDQEMFYPKVLRTGVPEVHVVTPALVARHARSEEHAKLLAELSTRALMAVPLRSAQATPFGVLSFGTSAEDRRYGPQDLELALELARRAGVAIENARLFERARTERLRAEDANRLKDEFLATVSHELRTPLTAMLGWVTMLRAGTLPPEKRERALETIERNARVQAKLVEDLLDVSRIISGKLRLEVKPVDAAQTVEAVLESLRPAAQSKDVSLQATVAPDAVVLGDAARLQQIVWNLVSNAVKFTPKHGQVHTVVSRRDSSVVIEVSDSGQGIRPEFLPHVFERFRQEEGSTTRRHGGLGLGLAIVRQLVELHGGTVAVHSEGEGHGATFSVVLPLSVARAADASPQAPGAGASAAAPGVPCSPELAGLRVLVVDDEPDTRGFLKALLESCSAQVRTAGSVKEAFEQLGASLPDLILSDIGMPEEDGYAFIRRLRALPQEAGGGLPAVALTAYARSEDRTRALLAGFRAHVPKPVEPAELVAVLASLVGRRESA